MERKRIFKAILSVMIVYQLVVIFLVPNQLFYVTQKIAPIVIPYANLMGFNTVWQFFSPDPGPPVYLEYEVFKEGELVGTFHFPPFKDPYWLREKYNRRLAAFRMVGKDNGLASKVFGPMLCREHPEATRLEMNVLTVKFPSLDEVQSGTPLNDLSVRKTNYMGSHYCK